MMAQTLAQTMVIWDKLYGEDHGGVIGVWCSMMRSIPLELFQQAVENCERADAFGVYIDPTAWMNGRDNIDQNKRMTAALLDFRKAIDFMQPAPTGAEERAVQ